MGLEGTIASRDSEIRTLKSASQETTKSLENVKIAIEEINKNQKRINSRLFELKENSSEIKDYLSITVPANIARLLNESRTGISSDSARN